MITTAAPVLSATGLRKSYGKGDTAVHAVAGIDLDLVAGEMVAIMGASGSGKTTLLHLLGGLTRLDAGSVRFVGEDLATLGDAALTRLRRRRLGVIFQSYNLMPTLSALDNVAVPLLLDGMSRTPDRVVARQQLEQVGMSGRAHHRPAQMSGGEQQRIAIARALVMDPQVVLADEPTGNLDRRNAQVVCDLLRKVATNATRAVALVTHEPAVAIHADRVVVLVDGRIAEVFTRADVATVEDLGRRYLRITSSA